MAYITLDQFIDKYSKLIDNDNLDTKALLVKMLSELSNSDISELTILLNKEGINIFNFLNKNEYDTIKLFDGKFDLNDLQTYFDDEFGFPLNVGFYEKYSMQEIVKLLNENRIDAAFLPHLNAIDSQYKSLNVAKFEIVCCKKGIEHLFNSKFITAKSLENQPIILFNDDFFQTLQIKKWFQAAGITPNVIMQTQQLSTLENMISSGKAIGFMFKQLCKKTGLQSVSLDKPMNVSVSIVWKNNKSTFKSMQNFLQYLKNFNIND